MINNTAAFFKYMKFTDFVDIGIITVFIYLILIWLKKARVRFIFMGMVMFGALYMAGRLFGLYLTTVALQAFFAAALIMIVIIFQDDIRRLFERVAILGVRRRHYSTGPFAQNIETIASALANLSRKNIGALVVIRGADYLDRHLEAGIFVDAAISQVLLESIFDKHVPSHDGAVIIDGDRLVKLGVYLPLSTNIREVGRLGTRHAAALGITERTDALSLVVSEENGVVSVAEEGRIRHLKDSNHLTNALHDFYRKKFPEKKGMRVTHFFTRHLLEKFIAVSVACILWIIFAHHTGSVRRDFIVPIEYRNLAASRIVNEPKEKEVTVTLSGTEQKFSLLKPDELKVSMDMSNIKDGENQLTLSSDLVRNSSGLSVVHISPAQITLDSYTLMPFNIPVELKTKGRLASGIALKDTKISPKSVSAMVPSTMNKKDMVILTEPVDLSPIKETTVVTPALVIPSGVRFHQDKLPEVKVTIEVESK